ncbi:SMP-30/gluconolactonase/LRE family protein [Aquiflexum sp. TKW24L]|uniref:SMP-30/gluconolactonase/LRE family protein n=1 Tax=Aquiflexum sp. TKW24L TaxID=2942212 RepID=UPI0020BF8359|nr:SMP-30/gluconolactonase/LRE family protein [Aquiflexum sp. TKW24L]MCL6257491.1 SMP-30/gluconolactonase/LRE family protein [Aquiflexum sp. TKW24L]
MITSKKNYLFAFITIFFAYQAQSQEMDRGSVVVKNATLVKVGEGYTFTEGPAVHRTGDVYFTDQPNDKIYKWSATKNEVTLFQEGTKRSNGMYFDRNDVLISCADLENQLIAIDDKGNSKVLIENFKGKRLNGPNDVWIAPNGGMYISDPLYKRKWWTGRSPEMEQDGQHLYYLAPDRIQFFRVDEKLVQPNGLVGTPDGKKLYVADIGDKKTYVYEIEEDGYLKNRKLFCEMGSDGMTIDNKGNVYLTGKGVTVFNPKGEQIAYIPVEESWTANVVFGGTERKTLFITALDKVYTLDMKVRGVW